jgi:hypothetical protein
MKLHQKFLKYILGVHTKTTNIAVLSELGRFPLYYNIIKAMLKYYYRLEKSQSTFPQDSCPFLNMELNELNMPHISHP